MQTVLSFLTAPLPPLAYTALGIAAVLLFAVHGAYRGIFKMLFGITSLILAYPLAEPFGFALRPLLALDYFPPMFHGVILATIGGLVAYALLWLLFFLLTILFSLDRTRYGWDRAIVMSGGALLGGIFGAVIVLILSWFLLIMGSLVGSMPSLSATTIQTGEEKPAQESSMKGMILLPARFIAGHNEAFRKSALGIFAARLNPATAKFDTGISVATEVMKNPKNMENLIEYEPVADIIKKDAVQNLMKDPEIQKMAVEGNIYGILNHPATKKMLSDPEIQKALENIDPEELKKMLEK